MTQNSIQVDQKVTPDIPGLSFRHYEGESDLEQIASITHRCHEADQLDSILTVDEIQRMFKYMANFDPSKDVVVVTVNDETVGYMYTNWVVEGKGDHIYRHKGYVLPPWRRKGIGHSLLKIAENRFLGIVGRHHPEGLRYLHTGVADAQKDDLDLLSKAGYRPARYFFEMTRDLTESIPTFELPSGIEVRAARPDHFKPVWKALEEAFQDHWGFRPGTEDEFKWWSESPVFQPDLWRIGWDGEEVAGLILNYIDHEGNQAFSRQRGYTEDIAVRRPWRRQGLARSLLVRSLQLLRDQGMQEAALFVDTENPLGALGLYESVGFNITKRTYAYRKSFKPDQLTTSKI